MNVPRIFFFLLLLSWLIDFPLLVQKSHTCLMCNFSACFSPSRTCHSINYMNTKHNYTLLKSKHKILSNHNRNAESLSIGANQERVNVQQRKKVEWKSWLATPIIHHHICDTCEKWFALVALWNCLFCCLDSK